MRHSAIEFSRQLRNSDLEFDIVFCTDMLNVAEFKGLVNQEISQLPLVIYFHENQFSYPNRFPRQRDLHFGFTNFTSALASDSAWFNSKFNRDSFFEELRSHACHWPDFVPHSAIEEAENKAAVKYPGIEFDPAKISRSVLKGSTHILWCARWEHDKNPDDFLKALRILDEAGFDFQLSLLGQSFRNVPPAIKTIRTEFSNRILYWGFQESTEDYWNVLCSADYFVSTALHEFFGISAIEAMVAGAIPLLPDRLSYPEILKLTLGEPEPYLYDGTPEGLAAKIIASELPNLTSRLPPRESQLESHLDLSWDRVATQFDDELERINIDK